MNAETSKSELSDWYYGEVAKLGLVVTDVPTVFRDVGVFRQVYRVPYPDGKTREQLEELIAELKIMVGIEPPSDDC